MKFESELKYFHSRKCAWKGRLRNGSHLSRPQCVKQRWTKVVSYRVKVVFWIRFLSCEKWKKLYKFRQWCKLVFYGTFIIHLSHWDRGKTATTSLTTFAKTFYWINMYEFNWIFHRNLFLRCEFTILRIGSDNGLAPTRRQTTIRTNDD